jgi:hypothetical protein
MLRRRRGGSCFRVEHLLLCGIPNLETIKEVNSASKPTNQWNKIFIYKMFPTNTHMLRGSFTKLGKAR